MSHFLHSPYLLYYLAGINFLTFVLYAFDKHFARSYMWRIPESSLLLAGFLGGSPAGFLAQHILRHKVRKASYQVKFWGLVLVQIGLAIYYHNDLGF